MFNRGLFERECHPILSNGNIKYAIVKAFGTINVFWFDCLFWWLRRGGLGGGCEALVV
jgi:hypothetical protein